MARRRFEFTDAKSDKFWEIDQEGTTVTVNFGRRGTDGQANTKTFDTEAEATTHATKQIVSKTKKGYTEVDASTGTMKTAPPTPAAKPAAAKAETTAKTTATPADAAASESAAPAAATAPAPPAEPVVQDVNYDGQEQLLLTDAEWSWAPWRNIPRATRPEPEPFDANRAVDLLLQDHSTTNYWNNGVRTVNPPVSMTREEAWFWMRTGQLMRESGRSEKQLASTLRKFAETPPADDQAFLDACWYKHNYNYRGGHNEFYYIGRPELAALACVLPAARLREVLLEEQSEIDESAREVIMTHMAYFLSDSELADWQEAVRAKVVEKEQEVVSQQSAWRQDHTIYALAGILGMTDIVDTYLKRERSGQYWVHDPTVCISAGDPALTREAIESGHCQVHSAHIVVGLIAQLEYDALDLFTTGFVEKQNYAMSTFAAMTGLQRIISPRTAPVMWLATGVREHAAEALEWLKSHPTLSILGLTPKLAGRSEEAASIARFLQGLRMAGMHEAFAAAQALMPPEHQALLQETVIDVVDNMAPMLTDEQTPAWLADLVDLKPPRKALPDWLDPAALVPLEDASGRLNPRQTTAILAALRDSKPDKPHAIIEALTANVSLSVREDWLWSLYEAWAMGGYESKAKWAFHAMGYLGGDRSVDRLAPLIRQWPFESQFKRACDGLDIYRMIGSDRALMHITSISQKAKSKGLQKYANEVADAIATARGMTKEELADRCVPDLGFDENGRLVYDFGPRQFTVVLDSDMKPAIRDDAGKVKTNLPKPSQKDDPEKSAAATDDWKLLKKQLRDLLKLQTIRLENAMIIGRSWSAEEFGSFLARHPVMTLIARRILWCTVGADGKPADLFRITDEQDYATVDDDTYALAADARVSVVHPLAIDPGLRDSWGEVFADYEIVAPFPQLDRPTYTLADVDPEATTICRNDVYDKTTVFAILGVTDRNGWTRGPALDGGCVVTWYKYFEAADQNVALHMDPGYGIGMTPAEFEDQAMPIVDIQAGTPDTNAWDYGIRKHPLKLRDVDPVVLSETLLDLDLIVAKTKPKDK